MGTDNLSRKLAVILHADVVASTTLVQRDEMLAHQRMQDVFHRFAEVITEYGGIAQELRGDALLAEFERASDAVAAALAFQSSNVAINATLDDDIRPELRIGISLGEVVIADGTITGAGVVLAQRLEQLAEAGGVVVQGAVAETVPTRLPYDFVSLGEQLLKGFEQPVRAFSACLRPGSEMPGVEVTEVASSAKSVELHSPGKPSIAVLPFANMSNDPRTGIFRRRYLRRHHHRLIADQAMVCDRAQFQLCLQGASCRYA